jgi:hypothetical protein
MIAAASTRPQRRARKLVQQAPKGREDRNPLHQSRPRVRRGRCIYPRVVQAVSSRGGVGSQGTG